MILSPTVPKIGADHLARRALIYVRQSTPEQLQLNPESTARQYGLRQRAYDLGWPAEQVVVIDADLGKSAVSADDRAGFQQLVAEVSLGHVGLVLSIETSRLARSGRDWYHLLELCALGQTLIADEDGVYDPALYNDRLLLGLKGTMSEAELHLLRQRLLGGALQKASRGELRIPLPTGYVWATDADGRAVIELDPDESVRAAIRDVFARFARLGSAAQVLRALVRDGATLPRRLRTGPAKGQVVWVPPGDWMVVQILKDPVYTGAYAYGRHRRRRPSDGAPRVLGRRPDPAAAPAPAPAAAPVRPLHGVVCLPPTEWPVLLRDHHAAYIDWPTYEATLRRLRANQADYARGQPGAAQRGAALLQGLARCGLCGHRMRLFYTGPDNDLPVYSCRRMQKLFNAPRCQEVRAHAVDAAVAQALLAALAPAPLAAALRAVADAEHETAARRETWRLGLERARYAAERAARQYDAVEPENRLVARELERRWNERLRELRQLEEAHARDANTGRLTLADAERAAIQRLAGDLPAVWADARTTSVDRKRLLRCLITAVVLTIDKATDRIVLELHWTSGARSRLVVSRPVRAYRALGRYPQLIERLRALAAERLTDKQIAARLEAEGLRPARGRHFHPKSIWLLREEHGIGAGSLTPPPVRTGTRRFTVHGLARELRIFPGTVYHWLLDGRLRSTQSTPGAAHVIDLTDAKFHALQTHVEHYRGRTQHRPSTRSKRGAA